MQAFVDKLGSVKPSTSKWHTFEKALAMIGGGVLCHEILPRAFCLAFDDQRQDRSEQRNNYNVAPNKLETPEGK